MTELSPLARSNDSVPGMNHPPSRRGRGLSTIRAVIWPSVARLAILSLALCSTDSVYAELGESLPGTLQVSFDTFAFSDDWLSRVANKIPGEFPELNNNPVAQGFHSTLGYFESLDQDQVLQLTGFLKSITASDLREYELLGTFTLLDPNRIVLIKVGHSAYYWGLRPHPDFIAWQVRFWKLMQKKAPELFRQSVRLSENGEITGDGVHISMVKWGLNKMNPEASIELSLDQEQAVRARLQKLIHSSLADYRLENQSDPGVIQFSLETHPVGIQLPAMGITSPPFKVATLGVSSKGEPKMSRWVRYRTGEVGTRNHQTRYWESASMISPATQVSAHSHRGLPEPVEHAAAANLEDFKRMIPHRLRSGLESAWLRLSPSYRPVLPDSNQSWVVTQTQDAESDYTRAQGILPEVTKDLLLSQLDTQQVDTGIGIYASAVNRVTQYPSDIDLLQPVMIHVPDLVDSLEQAKDWAAREFDRTVLGHYRQLIKMDRIRLIELRVGSAASMGISSSQIEDFGDNPYLSQKDLMRGWMIDSKGKKWSISDLVRLGDFTKSKLSLFDQNGNRQPISLQFSIGLKWKGQVVYLHTQQGKGVPPLMRTAVYDHPSTFAIAMSLAPSYRVVSAMRRGVLPYAARDILTSAFKENPREVFISAKLLKRIRRMLFLMNFEGAEFDRLLFVRVAKSLGWEKFEFEEFIADYYQQLIHGINLPVLRQFNLAREYCNNLYEFAERGQKIDSLDWQARVREGVALMHHLRAIIWDPANRKHWGKTQTLQYRNWMLEFESFIIHWKKVPSIEAANQWIKTNEHLLERVEKNFYRIEQSLITGPRGLSEPVVQFTKALVRHLPHEILEYLDHTQGSGGGAMDSFFRRVMSLPKLKGLPSLVEKSAWSCGGAFRAS